jgi:hypothetical protein
MFDVPDKKNSISVSLTQCALFFLPLSSQRPTNDNQPTTTNAIIVSYVLPLTNNTQTSIRVRFSVPLSAPHLLQWKAYGDLQQDYALTGAAVVTVPAGATTAEVVDLEPGNTYCLRLLRQPALPMGGDTSAPTATFGPELIVDTEQVGCTPKTSSSCCIVS